MKQLKLWTLFFFVVALACTGCRKDENNLTAPAAINDAYVAVGYQAFSSSNGTVWDSVPYYNTVWDQNSVQMTSVAYGNGLYVAVGYFGRIFTSADGVSWQQQTVTWGGNMTSVIYVSQLQRFVALQSSASYTSPDGIHWSLWYEPALSGIRDMAYGNGIIVAVGDNGMICTSPDGQAWTPRIQPTAPPTINSIAFGNGMFVAATEWNLIYYSTDGLTWQTDTLPHMPAGIKDVCFGNGKFVACTYGASMWSADGVNWQTVSLSPTRHHLISLAFGGHSFVAISAASPPLFSVDGINWIESTIPATGRPPLAVTGNF